MATFRKRSGKWQARVQRQGYPDQCKTFFMRSDAESWARKTEIELDQGILNSKANPNTLLKELLVRYKCEVTSKKKFASVEEYRVTAWQKHPLANYAISKIKSSDIAQWRDEKIKLKKAPNTIRLDLAVLSHLFTVEKTDDGSFAPFKQERGDYRKTEVLKKIQEKPSTKTEFRDKFGGVKKCFALSEKALVSLLDEMEEASLIKIPPRGNMEITELGLASLSSSGQ